MKKVAVILVLAFLAYGYMHDHGISLPWTSTPTTANSVLGEALNSRQSNVQVEGRGTVVRLLSDDLYGSSHQRFILKLDSGQTVLISHNIDLAPYVNGLNIGDGVEFFGEYEWNDKGGVVHWTHHDPNGRHVAGWLKHRGRTYQ